MKPAIANENNSERGRMQRQLREMYNDILVSHDARAILLICEAEFNRAVDIHLGEDNA